MKTEPSSPPPSSTATAPGNFSKAGQAPPWTLKEIITSLAVPIILFLLQPSQTTISKKLLDFISSPRALFESITCVALVLAFFRVRKTNTQLRELKTQLEANALIPSAPIPNQLPKTLNYFYQRFCDTLNRPGQTPPRDFLIHTFYCEEGLHSDAQPAPKDVEDGLIDRGTGRRILDPASVLRLWADSNGGSIKASLGEDANQKHLEVSFVNPDPGASTRPFASNITIRPGGKKAYQRQPGKNILRIEVKIPDNKRRAELGKINLCFRLVDQLNTHWLCKSSKELFVHAIVEFQDRPEKNSWQTIDIRLDRTEHWEVFPPDGNYLYPAERPAIDEMILAVVVYAGGFQGPQSLPVGGQGRIWLRNPYYV